VAWGVCSADRYDRAPAPYKLRLPCDPGHQTRIAAIARRQFRGKQTPALPGPIWYRLRQIRFICGEVEPPVDALPYGPVVEALPASPHDAPRLGRSVTSACRVDRQHRSLRTTATSAHTRLPAPGASPSRPRSYQFAKVTTLLQRDSGEGFRSPCNAMSQRAEKRSGLICHAFDTISRYYWHSQQRIAACRCPFGSILR
jgi:hypothetical protein